MIKKLENWTFSTKLGKLLFILIFGVLFGTAFLAISNLLYFVTFISMFFAVFSCALVAAITEKRIKKWF